MNRLGFVSGGGKSRPVPVLLLTSRTGLTLPSFLSQPLLTMSPNAGEGAAAAFGGMSSGATPSPFPLLNLPRELQLHIVAMACQPQHGTKRTTLNLLCVSRQINTLVIPILYKHIRVTSPSSLFSLYKALLAHPERGTMIRSLHLGPDEELRPSHWPIVERRKKLILRPSLDRHDGDDDLIPKWLPSGWGVLLSQPGTDCRSRALAAALDVAMRTLNVDPFKQLTGNDGNDIKLVSKGAAGTSY